MYIYIYTYIYIYKRIYGGAMVANLLPSKAFPENSGGRLAESTSRGAAVTLQRQALLGCLDFIGINIYITKIGIYIYVFIQQKWYKQTTGWLIATGF